jgi:hypothetical protein
VSTTTHTYTCLHLAGTHCVEDGPLLFLSVFAFFLIVVCLVLISLWTLTR